MQEIRTYSPLAFGEVLPDLGADRLVDVLAEGCVTSDPETKAKMLLQKGSVGGGVAGGVGSDTGSPAIVAKTCPAPFPRSVNRVACTPTALVGMFTVHHHRTPSPDPPPLCTPPGLGSTFMADRSAWLPTRPLSPPFLQPQSPQGPHSLSSAPLPFPQLSTC